MQICRVSNAGVLLELDKVKILLDGFCTAVGPYLPTDENLRAELFRSPPDVLAFTHDHGDHFHGPSADQYHKQTLRPVLGPENLPYGTSSRGLSIGPVTILPVKSRHIGKEYFHTSHVSYQIQGSKTIWFMGDAVPSQWRGVGEHCDILIAPFAYALSESAWDMTCRLARQQVVLVHMPLPEQDPDGLWPQVEAVTKNTPREKFFIPKIGQCLKMP